MQVEKRENSSISHIYTVTISDAEFREVVDRWIAKKAETVRIDGFRKGKVPIGMVRQQFILNAKNHALEELVTRGVTEVEAQHGGNIIGRPEVEIKSYEEGKDLIFEVEITLFPDVDVSNLGDLNLEKIVCDVSQAEFDEAYSKYQEEFTSPFPTEEPAQEGDTVIIDLEVFHERKRLEPFCNENIDVIVGGPPVTMFNSIEQLVIGAVDGDERTTSHKFSKDYKDRSLAGREVSLVVKVVHVMRSKHTELTEETAIKAGFDSLDGVEASLWKYLRMCREKQLRVCNKLTVMNALSDAYAIEVPESLVEMDVQSTLDEINAAKERGEDIDDDVVGKTDDEIREEYRPIARRRTGLAFVMMRIFEKRKLKITPEDFQSVVRESFVHSFTSYTIMIAAIHQYEKLMFRFFPEVIERAVVDTVFDEANVTERVITLEELKNKLEDTLSGEDLKEYDPFYKLNSSVKEASKEIAFEQHCSEASEQGHVVAGYDSAVGDEPSIATSDDLIITTEDDPAVSDAPFITTDDDPAVAAKDDQSLPNNE
jgi:trigger factor